jgi:hypothetical protein
MIGKGFFTSLLGFSPLKLLAAVEKLKRKPQVEVIFVQIKFILCYGKDGIAGFPGK